MSKYVSYAQSGVDIDANDVMVDNIQSHLASTYGPRVINVPWGFAGLFRLDYDEKLFKKNYRNPVLVACTDGVGSKVQVAAKAKKFDTVGIDLVAMSVNDMLVMGAEPLFFLDYVALHKLEPRLVAQMVKGVAAGCRQADCALLGGETAEMPDTYRRGDFDMAGFAVGVVEKNRIITGKDVRPGDRILGLGSSGLHSNGYALARNICFKRARLKVTDTIDELDGTTLGDALLAPSVTRRLIADVVSRAPSRDPIVGLDELTPREREILELVGAGMSNDEIADRLTISKATAKTHVSRIMGKLEARDRAQLVVIAYESGLVVPSRAAR
jgi:phosphoribosylformylglycinamidine cyclo-ligase